RAQAGVNHRASGSAHASQVETGTADDQQAEHLSWREAPARSAEARSEATRSPGIVEHARSFTGLRRFRRTVKNLKGALHSGLAESQKLGAKGYEWQSKYNITVPGVARRRLRASICVRAAASSKLTVADSKNIS